MSIEPYWDTGSLSRVISWRKVTEVTPISYHLPVAAQLGNVSL